MTLRIRILTRRILGSSIGVDFGIPNARLIAPGSSVASLIINRMERRDVHGMPPIESNLINTFTVARISAWIDGLSGCD